MKGRLNFSCKSITAANVDLTEFLLDNWLKNNHITVDKIYYLCSLFVFFMNFRCQIYFSTAENRHNRIPLQLAKIRLKWISQSNGSIGHPLGFVIDRLNTSASLYRIAPCLSCWDRAECYLHDNDKQNHNKHCHLMWVLLRCCRICSYYLLSGKEVL